MRSTGPRGRRRQRVREKSTCVQCFKWATLISQPVLVDKKPNLKRNPVFGRTRLPYGVMVHFTLHVMNRFCVHTEVDVDVTDERKSRGKTSRL